MIFLDRYSKNVQISNLIKIRLVGAEWFVFGRTDRQRDRQIDRQIDRQTDKWMQITKLIVAFRGFTNAAKTREGIIKRVLKI